MRALLINPWIYDFAAYDLWSKPLGLLTIADCLKRLGCDVTLIDCLDRFHPALKNFKIKPARSAELGCGNYHSEIIEKPAVFKNIPRRYKRYGMPKELFTHILEGQTKPDIILVTSGMTYWYEGCVDAIKILKNAFPKVPIILGGTYASLCFEHAKRTSGADLVFKKNDIREIVEAINNLTGTTLDYAKIRSRPPLFPAYDLYPNLKYITLRTSRGCPFKCSYCGWYLIEDCFEQLDADYIIERIEYFHKTRGVRDFSFYDDALLYRAADHIKNILEGLLERNVRARFHTPNGLHNRFLTKDLALLLKASGFVMPRLALETSQPKRQAQTGLKTTNEEFLNAVEYLKTAGYGRGEIGVYIMMGLPDQSIDEVRSSVEFASAQGVRVFLEEYSPIPGTPDYEKSGLRRDADPLLHNNSVFPLYDAGRYMEFQKIKTWTHGLNNNIM